MDLYLKKNINILFVFILSIFDKLLNFLIRNVHHHDHEVLIITLNFLMNKHTINQSSYKKELFAIYHIQSQENHHSLLSLNIL